MILPRCLLSLCCATLLAANPEAPPRLLEKPDFFTGPAAVQTFAAGTFFHLSGRATLADLPTRISEMVPQLERALRDTRLTGLGPIQVVYQGMGKDPGQPFEVEVGVLVPKGTKPAGGGQVRVLPAFTAATTLFTGPIAHIGKAYEALYPSLLASGRIPTAESRQMVLFWEGEASSNNILLIEIGLQ